MALVLNISFPKGKKHVYDKLLALVEETGDKISQIAVAAIEAYLSAPKGDEEKLDDIITRLARVERRLDQAGSVVLTGPAMQQANDQGGLQAAALEAIGL
jgi:hypothetical protein